MPKLALGCISLVGTYAALNPLMWVIPVYGMGNHNLLEPIELLLTNRKTEDVQCVRDSESEQDNPDNSECQRPSDGDEDGAPNRESSGITCRHCPRPNFPPELREQGIEGSVVVTLRYDREGRVTEVWLDRSSGYVAFDRAVLEAVKQYEFETDGRSREITIEF